MQKTLARIAGSLKLSNHLTLHELGYHAIKFDKYDYAVIVYRAVIGQRRAIPIYIDYAAIGQRGPLPDGQGGVFPDVQRLIAVNGMLAMECDVSVNGALNMTLCSLVKSLYIVRRRFAKTFP